MRWSLELSELDFTVEHRAETKIPNVYALSRHVGTVLNESKLSPEEILLTSKDQFCKQLKAGSYSSRKEFFYDDTGLIDRQQKNDKHQLFVPGTLIRNVIRENHDPIYAAHPGAKRTCDLLALSFW